MPKPYLTDDQRQLWLVLQQRVRDVVDDVRNYDYAGAASSYGRQLMSALRPADTLDAYTTNGIPRRLP